MKNNKIFLILVLGAFLASPVFAQDNSNPGMLPGNPFYFLKEWGRGVKNTLTFNPVKKAELQLSVVNEKAAEIKKLKGLLPSSSKTLSNALDNYQKAIESLKQKVDGIKDISGSEPDAFLNQLSDSAIKQVQLFSELKNGVGDTIKNKLSDLQEKITELIAGISSNLETPDEFKCRLEKIIKGQDDSAFKEITIAEVLDQFNEKISKEKRLELLKVEENLLLKFQSRLQSEDFNQALSEILPQFPGDSARKIKVLDQIKEGVSDNNIKNKLNLARQDILDKAVENKEIRKPEAEKMIGEASDLLQDLQDTASASSTPKSSIISGLVSKAKFNLDQAKGALDLDNYGQAFGQASASAASSNAALNYISKFNMVNGVCAADDVNGIKEYYDEIISKMKELGLNKDNATTTQSLLAKSEQAIAKISDLVKKNAKADTLIPLIKDAKLMLSQIDNSLNDKSE